MKYMKLNNTELEVSQCALGTATIGAPGIRYDSEDILNTFTEQGGNLLDSALVYADWLPGKKHSSEKTIGRWMKNRGNREKLIIATKGAHPRLDAMNIPRLSDKDITADLETSLQNLGTDYIDIYFLHRDDVNRDVGTIMDVMDRHVRAGKIRYIGLSNWSPERIGQAVSYCRENGLAEPVANQLFFSPAKINRENIDQTLQVMDRRSYDFHADNQMCVFGFSSQANGWFSKIDSGKELPRGLSAMYENETNRLIYKKLRRLSEQYGRSIAEAVVSVLVSNPGFQTIPVIGFSNKQQLLSSMKGTDMVISEQEALDIIRQTFS